MKELENQFIKEKLEEMEQNIVKYKQLLSEEERRLAIGRLDFIKDNAQSMIHTLLAELNELEGGE